ncbi:MAG TPA: hypothetical protein VH372_19145 [Actinospica sp.]|nr:hypothetical protein [Actinospica sp.]
MDPDSIAGRCPGCGAEDHLERASGAVAETADHASPAHALDPEWPWFMQWSVFQFAAITCALLAAMAIGAGGNGSGSRESGPSGALPAVGITLVLLAGAIGLRNTWRNRSQARRLNPRVREIHEHAVYCSACACVYFDARDLPGGLVPYDPMPVADYRGRLWQACGYVRRL